MPEKIGTLFSCEHGGNRVPPAYSELFQGQEQLLCSHAGYDPGALQLARELAKRLGTAAVFATTTRLLVDLNRSPNSRNLFSQISRKLDCAARNHLLEEHYLPYRLEVREKLAEKIAHGEQVVHLSIHSFTPELSGKIRTADLGLLYDPARTAEKLFCHNWKQLLRDRLPSMNIRCNYPYLGTADGLVRELRHYFHAQDYLGIELEVNQALLDSECRFPVGLQRCLWQTLLELIPTD